MSYPDSHDVKEHVRQAVDIVDLVGDYLPLRREGHGFKALCPWHDDRKPSLTVNPQRQSFKCWVCDIGGDIFSFVMRMERVEFPEALAILAQRAGIALPAPGRSPAAGPAATDKQDLYRAMAWAERQYHDCLLHSPLAEPARQYLAGRGITADSLRRFHLGFAPQQPQWLVERARQQGIAAPLLEGVGLLTRRDDAPGSYERFRGRVLFSIRDPQGRPVGMGGRILPDAGSTSPAKYINTPETPLFSKSHLLYGLDLARDAIGKSSCALVMEGYTDCIVAHQQGFPHAVAVLGTALGPRHIRLLRRYTDRVMLVLDGDAAGQRRTNEVLELFVAEQLDLRILSLTEGLDPCDFLLSRGAEAFIQLQAQAVDALEHELRSATEGLDAESDVHRLHVAMERVLATLAKVPRLNAGTTSAAKLKEEQILHRLARKCGVAEETLRSRLATLRRGTRRQKAPSSGLDEPAPDWVPPRLAAWERELFEIACADAALWSQIAAGFAAEELETEPARALYAAFDRVAAEYGQPAFPQVIAAVDDPRLKSALVSLDDDASRKAGSAPDQRLEALLERRARLREECEQNRSRERLSAPGSSPDEAARILDQMIQQRRRRMGISSPTEG